MVAHGGAAPPPPAASRPVGHAAPSASRPAASELAARSLALERAYVHDVYEQAPAGAGAVGAEAHARTAKRFLAELEPGSLVCDVGCGGGQHLMLNPRVWSLGGDRCSRLCDTARGRGGEVLMCDNLALPFKDGAFDAVLSAAVVHHFATAERRARALRELARVLRIGGRVLVTVWAMEQRGRRFESQDVLVPWHRPQTLCSPSLELKCNAPADDDELHLLANVSDSESRDNQKRSKCKKEQSYSTETPRAISYSPGDSSLSSPNETCYSFVRKAIQKLAGRQRASRPWFLDSWSNYSRDSTNKKFDRSDSEENEADIQDLPIELRRIEEDDVILTAQTFMSSETSSEVCISQKSKSFSDILALQERSLVRSRSSVPSFEGILVENELLEKEKEPISEPPTKPKPKLVKQKKSINEEDLEEDLDKPTDMKSLVKELPTFKDSMHRIPKKGVIKQSSLNEELMSRERLREREKLRKNIQKQASLNEEYLYRRYRTLDSLRDSFFSTSANTAKKIQSLKNGLTTKLKNSTTNIEKVSVTGFVRMFQGWKSYDSSTNTQSTTSNINTDNCNNSMAESKSTSSSSDENKNERRSSKEDGSDSSKDSSLQSDTSVDSEDSFASVIYIPKNDGSSTQDPLSPTPLSPGPTSPRLKVSSVPTSPRIKTAPGLTSPRLKQMPFVVYPIIRPPGSPKATQAPCQVSKILTGQLSLKSTIPLTRDSSIILETRSQPNSPPRSNAKSMIDCVMPQIEDYSNDLTSKCSELPEEIPEITSADLIAEINKDIEEIHKLTAETELIQPRVLQDVKPYPKITLQTVAELPEIPQFKDLQNTSANDNLDTRYAERKKKERLRQIRELLKQKPTFMNSGPRGVFPLVRRYSAQDGNAEPSAKTLPKLLSLELFNPETDDMDSDSSGASSPDSVDSVIKVVPDDADTKDKHANFQHKDLKEADVPKHEPKLSSSSHSLLEAAAEVAHSLDDTCETIIQSSPRSKRKELGRMTGSDAMAIIHGGSGSSDGSSWSLNKLAPGDLRLLEERSRSHSHTSSSGSTSSLERLSPGRRSKERSPRQGSNSNSTWSLNRLSPIKFEARSFEEKTHTSPTRFPYDSMSLSGIDDKPMSKSDSFTRLKANEKLVMCKSDIITSAEEEREWNQQCLQHLTEFAEKLSEKLLHEIDQYSKRLSEEDFEFSSSEKGKAERKKRIEEDKATQSVLDDLSESLQHLNDPYIHKISTDIQGLSKLSAELHEKNKYLATLNENGEGDDVSKLFPKCALKSKDRKKCTAESHDQSMHGISPRGSRTDIRKRERSEVDNINNNNELHVPKKVIIMQDERSEPQILANDDENHKVLTVIDSSNGNPEITVDTKSDISQQSLETGYSIESEISVDSFCTDKRSSLKVGQSTDSSEVEKMEISPESITSRSSGASTVSTAPLKSGFSIESSEACDMSGSGSDWSKRDTSGGKSGSMASLGCASTASLASTSDWSKDRKLIGGRSSSEETAPVRGPLVRQVASVQESVQEPEKRSLEPSLSDTSQDSLPSEGGGGAITYHRYYHVFREGELEQLIEKYVENLHIITSFYDQANYCVIAEKVQVWTI